jgi:hypothetical protein
VETKLERDVYLYRAYIAQRKYRVVLDEIHGTSPAELQPIKMLAEYFSKPSARFVCIAYRIKCMPLPFFMINRNRNRTY